MSFPEAVTIPQMDELQIHIDLPLSGTYYPLGFRIHITTNSRHVLEAAEESWGHWAPEFECQPLRFRVIVQPEGDLCGEPSHRAYDNLYSVVSDRDNFGMFDTSSLSGSIFISERTAADHIRLRWFYIESLCYMILTQRYVVPVHAACIARGDAGILLCGPSGAGKSTLSYACARAGWTYVSDDCVFLVLDSPGGFVLGRHLQVRLRVDAPVLFPELAVHAARERPNGKVSIEIPMSAFPQIRTAARVPVSAIVFLDRRAGAARLQAIAADEAVRRLLAEPPSYGDRVDRLHEPALRRLAEAPALRMQYETLDDALDILQTIRVP